MDVSITHLDVPVVPDRQARCLGPDGSVAHVARTLGMIGGRWKLSILFRLFAECALRPSHLLRDMPQLSQKVLTEQLRELQADGLVTRHELPDVRLHVEYSLSDRGRGLMPSLLALREFSRGHSSDSPSAS